MTYSLINKCAKNYYNRTFIVQVIAKNVVTCFLLRHSVLKLYLTNCASYFPLIGLLILHYFSMFAVCLVFFLVFHALKQLDCCSAS